MSLLPYNNLMSWCKEKKIIARIGKDGEQKMQQMREFRKLFRSYFTVQSQDIFSYMVLCEKEQELPSLLLLELL